MTMDYSEFRARVLDAFHRSRTTRGARPTEDVLDALLADVPVGAEHLAQLLRELPALVILPVYLAGLYAWAFRRLAGIAAARGTPDLVVAAVRPLMEVGTLPSPTWRNLAGTLEAVGSAEALRLLRRIPVRHCEMVLHDDTLEALAARDREEPSPEPPGPVDLARITTFPQARALACELLAPELFLRAALEGRELPVPDALVHHVQYDGMGVVILALAAEGRQLDDLPRILRAGSHALGEWLAVVGTDPALAAIEALARHPESGPILAWWAEEMEPIITDPFDAFSAIGQALACATAEERDKEEPPDEACEE